MWVGGGRTDAGRRLILSSFRGALRGIEEPAGAAGVVAVGAWAYAAWVRWRSQWVITRSISSAGTWGRSYKVGPGPVR